MIVKGEGKSDENVTRGPSANAGGPSFISRNQPTMRHYHFTIAVLAFSSGMVPAQEAGVTPTEELRTTISEWVETMRKVQAEENDWERDKEVLQNYREGLEREIGDLKEQIASAKTRKEGADKESLDKVNERNRFAEAKDGLAVTVRRLEESLHAKLTLLPAPLRQESRVSQMIEDLERDIKLPEDRRGENVSKRLLNIINLLTEAEKFQQTVHIRPELKKDSTGREFNMRVVYFGLAAAYAVNDDGSFALVGKPTADGWAFEENRALAAEIRRLIASTTGEIDATFVNLPFVKP